jgi:PAS domain S-box-containing protein
MTKIFKIIQAYNWIFGGIIVLSAILLSRLYNFLLFHSIAELFSIVIAFAIFVIAWNSRRFLDNNYLLFLGIAYLFIGAIDMVHTLAYKGMGVFPEYDANLPTQLWIMARYMESISLLSAPLFFKRKIRLNLIFTIYLAISGLLFSSVFYWRIFPDCFIEGKGLTSFKIISEYIISLILLGSIIFLISKQKEFDRQVFIWVIWSIITTIISELAFTFYISVYGLSNLIGHVFKIISFYLIYKALIETGLTKPYDLLWRNLKLSEERLREERDKAQNYLDIAEVIFLVIGADEKVLLINKKGSEILGYEEKDIVGKNWFDHFLPEKIKNDGREVFREILVGKFEPFKYMENAVLNWKGEEKIIAWHNAPLRDKTGKVIGTLSSGMDITELKKKEREREELIQELREALSKVKTLSGLLPICSSCKKIRDDKGYWRQIEAYIRDHSAAEFSHALCPECAKKLYPEFQDIIENKGTG